MPRNQQAVESNLTSKGFAKSEGDHHYFHYYSKAGKKSRVFTKTSHGSKEITDSLLALMARQCKLTKADFLRLVDCPMSRDEYEATLVTQGLVDAPR